MENQFIKSFEKRKISNETLINGGSILFCLICTVVSMVFFIFSTKNTNSELINVVDLIKQQNIQLLSVKKTNDALEERLHVVEHQLIIQESAIARQSTVEKLQTEVINASVNPIEKPKTKVQRRAKIRAFNRK